MEKMIGKDKQEGKQRKDRDKVREKKKGSGNWGGLGRDEPRDSSLFPFLPSLKFGADLKGPN